MIVDYRVAECIEVEILTINKYAVRCLEPIPSKHYYNV